MFLTKAETKGGSDIVHAKVDLDFLSWFEGGQA